MKFHPKKKLHVYISVGTENEEWCNITVFNQEVTWKTENKINLTEAIT